MIVSLGVLCESVLAWDPPPPPPPCQPNWQPWQVDIPPTVSAICPELSRFCVEAVEDWGGPISISVTIQTTEGTKKKIDSNGCEEPQSAPLGISDITVTWTVSGCGATPSGGTGSTATFYVNASGHCTVTFNVTGRTYDPDGTYAGQCSVTFDVEVKRQTRYTPSNATLLFVYFLVENVGLRLYNHALTEVYAKVPKCDSNEQWNLQSSIASLRLQNDPVMWSEEHKYSFEQGYTPMSTGSVGIGDPACQYREREANLWVTPQAGLKGIAHTVSLVWYGSGGHTPGVIGLGSTVEVNIQ